MQQAMYSIRTLLSSQRLTVHSLKTDQKSGELRAYENTVEGPASVMISTTNFAAFDHESVTRFFTLFLDESREQTQAILDYQDAMAGMGRLELRARRAHLHELQEAGYITQRLGRKGQRYCYSLVEDDIPPLPAVETTRKTPEIKRPT